MGHIYADLTLRNPRKPELRAMEVSALADTGAITLCLPQHVATQLDLETLEMREVTTADGQHHKVPYAGPVEIKFENRGCYVGALIMGDEVLLGAVPMEDMDLVVSPRLQRISVNPASPNIPQAKVKSFGGRVTAKAAEPVQAAA